MLLGEAFNSSDFLEEVGLASSQLASRLKYIVLKGGHLARQLRAVLNISHMGHNKRPLE
jgi:hypothetical protein